MDKRTFQNILLTYLHLPYRWGGDDPLEGMDCCLASGSKVLSEYGYKNIDDIKMGDKVFTVIDGKLHLRSVIATHINGLKSVYEVRIGGTKILATDKHKFLTVRSPENLSGWSIRKGRSLNWVELKDLRVGDIVVSYCGYSGSGVDYSLDKIRFFGAMIGDGSLHTDGDGCSLCFLSEKKRAQIQRYFEIAQSEFGFNNSFCFHEQHGITFHSIDMVNQLKDMGFSGKSSERIIPGWLWNSNQEQFEAFLDGYFLADGHEYSRKRNTEKGTSISSASNKLINELHSLCFIRGYHVSNITVNQRHKDIYIKGKRVQNALPLHSFTIYHSEKKAFPSRGVGPDPYSDFKLSRDFHFQKVRRIEALSIPVPTFDITVEDGANYIAEGFVVHNSGLVQEILSIFSLDPDGDQTAHGLYLHFRKAEHGTVSAAEPGALCFYGSEHLVTHIAICFDNGVVLEAGGGGSKTTSYDLAVKQNAFVRLRHYMRRKDLVAVIKPIGLDLS